MDLSIEELENCIRDKKARIQEEQVAGINQILLAWSEKLRSNCTENGNGSYKLSILPSYNAHESPLQNFRTVQMSKDDSDVWDIRVYLRNSSSDHPIYFYSNRLEDLTPANLSDIIALHVWYVSYKIEKMTSVDETSEIKKLEIRVTQSMNRLHQNLNPSFSSRYVLNNVLPAEDDDSQEDINKKFNLVMNKTVIPRLRSVENSNFTRYKEALIQIEKILKKTV